MHVNTWKQSGRVSLWRYRENTRNYPGWHLNADAAGCRSLIELLDALEHDGAGFRTIKLVAPTAALLAIPNNGNAAARWTAPTSLRMTLCDRPDRWQFALLDVAAELAIGVDWLVSLRAGISGIIAGHGDYSIGPAASDERITFWWNPSSTEKN